MKVYNLLMESFYYDGDDFVIEDVHTEIHSCSSFETAKSIMENAIAEELSGKYTEDMLIRDGDDYAVFKDSVGCDDERTLYRLTIYERELDG